jgi:hypothetical protein
MNHLTNLYKHKCEQLQEQINNLTRMLNEVNSAGMVDIPSPFQSPVPLNNPTGINPDVFAPHLHPDRIPTYQPPIHYGPKPPLNPIPGHLWQDPSGRTWVWRDDLGKWRFYIPNQFDRDYGFPPLTPDGRYVDYQELHNAPKYGRDQYYNYN